MFRCGKPARRRNGEGRGSKIRVDGPTGGEILVGGSHVGATGLLSLDGGELPCGCDRLRG